MEHDNNTMGPHNKRRKIGETLCDNNSQTYNIQDTHSMTSDLSEKVTVFGKYIQFMGITHEQLGNWIKNQMLNEKNGRVVVAELIKQGYVKMNDPMMNDGTPLYSWIFTWRTLSKTWEWKYLVSTTSKKTTNENVVKTILLSLMIGALINEASVPVMKIILDKLSYEGILNVPINIKDPENTDQVEYFAKYLKFDQNKNVEYVEETVQLLNNYDLNTTNKYHVLHTLLLTNPTTSTTTNTITMEYITKHGLSLANPLIKSEWMKMFSDCGANDELLNDIIDIYINEYTNENTDKEALNNKNTSCNKNTLCNKEGWNIFELYLMRFHRPTQDQPRVSSKCQMTVDSFNLLYKLYVLVCSQQDNVNKYVSVDRRYDTTTIFQIFLSVVPLGVHSVPKLFVKSLEIINSYLKHNATAALTSITGKTILHAHAKNSECDVELLKILFKARPNNLKAADYKGNTPYHTLCKSGHPCVLNATIHTFFISNGVNVNEPNNKGETPVVLLFNNEMCCFGMDYDDVLTFLNVIFQNGMPHLFARNHSGEYLIKFHKSPLFRGMADYFLSLEGFVLPPEVYRLFSEEVILDHFKAKYKLTQRAQIKVAMYSKIYATDAVDANGKIVITTRKGIKRKLDPKIEGYQNVYQILKKQHKVVELPDHIWYEIHKRVLLMCVCSGISYISQAATLARFVGLDPTKLPLLRICNLLQRRICQFQPPEMAIKMVDEDAAELRKAIVKTINTRGIWLPGYVDYSQLNSVIEALDIKSYELSE